MTYRTAVQKPIPARGNGSNAVYLRHGFQPRLAARYRLLGMPATVAKAFTGTPAEPHLEWLAATFSVTGLRSLTNRPLTRLDMDTLRALAEQNLPTLRGYVSQTRLLVHQIEWLMERSVSCQSTLTWTRRLPLLHRDTNLVAVLTAATIVHGVPDGHVAGWVRFANRHEVLYEGDSGPWRFLGGSTALMAQAGLSPREAFRMTRTGTVDVAALQMLAGLRTCRGSR